MCLRLFVWHIYDCCKKQLSQVELIIVVVGSAVKLNLFVNIFLVISSKT